MSQYRKGQKVRIVDADGDPLTVGREYEIANVDGGDTRLPIQVRGDRGSLTWLYPRQFELVPEAPAKTRTSFEVTRAGSTVWTRFDTKPEAMQFVIATCTGPGTLYVNEVTETTTETALTPNGTRTVIDTTRRKLATVVLA